MVLVGGMGSSVYIGGQGPIVDPRAVQDYRCDPRSDRLGSPRRGAAREVVWFLGCSGQSGYAALRRRRRVKQELRRLTGARHAVAGVAYGLGEVDRCPGLGKPGDRREVASRAVVALAIGRSSATTCVCRASGPRRPLRLTHEHQRSLMLTR